MDTTDKPISEYTDDELKALLKQRALDKEETAREEHRKYVDMVSQHLTADAIQALAPNHGRTSCTDAYLSNGWGSADYGPRCIRCALLETLHNGYIDYPFRFRVTIEKLTP